MVADAHRAREAGLHPRHPGPRRGAAQESLDVLPRLFDRPRHRGEDGRRQRRHPRRDEGEAARSARAQVRARDVQVPDRPVSRSDHHQHRDGVREARQKGLSVAAAFEQLWNEARGDPAALERVTLTGTDPILPTDLKIGTAASAVIAAAGLAAAELWHLRTGRAQTVSVDLRAAVAAFRSERYLRLDGQLTP